MRWQQLFDDLEAQFDAVDHLELSSDVRDRTRRELALVPLSDRLRANVGAAVLARLTGGTAVRGRLLDSGPDWMLLGVEAGRELLLASAALSSLSGLGPRTLDPAGTDEVAKRLDLRWALRGLARSRTGVTVMLTDGSSATGTLDRLGADHLDLAEHPPGEPRRPSSVRAVLTVPLTALAAVQSG